MDFLQPKGWKRPSGYSNAVKASGELVFVAGQIGWDRDQLIVADDIVAQTRQALENVLTVLREAHATATDVVRLTWFVTDIAAYLERSREIGEAYRAVMGDHYPAMSLVEVRRLVEPGAYVEIEATAVI